MGEELRLLAVMEPRVAAGFSLAGVAAVGARDAAQAGELLAGCLGSDEYGLILVAEKLLAGLDRRLRARLEESLAPVFVEVPLEFGMREPEDAAAGVDEIVRRSVGYSIKLE